MGPILQNLNAPKPPAFLDPLYSLEDCYYYAVPRFFDIKHPYNRWLVGRVKANDADAIRRKMEITPTFFQKKYFQILDNPSLYFEDNKAGGPMYHSKCVLYLTPLGISLYMKSREVTELLLTYRDTYDERLSGANEVQFASHMQNPSDGDFHAFPSFLIAIRREFFSAGEQLQAAGWDPGAELALPVRRRYERRAFYFRDWLDVALHLLSNKSFYPIHLLANGIIGAPTYKYSQLPLSLVRPGPRDRSPTPIGLIDVGDLPLGVRLTGAANLLELTEQYDRYLQLQQTMYAIKELKREAEACGFNSELVLQMAQDPLQSLDRNNNARSAARGGKANDSQPFYCSEPLRILLFSLEKDTRCKSLQQCLDAFNVYVKRGFFFNSDRLPWASPRARDQRNLANCLLNMVRREQDRIDAILDKIRSGKRRFAHVEDHKVLENRRAQHVTNIDRLIGCLAQALLHTKEIVDFLHTSRFPLYSAQSVDFQLVPNVSLILPSVRFGVIREFNRTRSAWRHLTKEMLVDAAKDSALTLFLKVGKAPSRKEVVAYANQKKRASKKTKGKA